MRNVIDRASLKSKARHVLGKFYVLLFVVSLVAAILSGSCNGNSGNSRSYININSIPSIDVSNNRVAINGRTIVGPEGIRWNNATSLFNSSSFNVGRGSFTSINWLVRSILAVSMAGIGFAVGFGALAFNALVAYPIKTGCKRVFIRSGESLEKPNLYDMVYAFRSGGYLNIALAGFLTSLFTFLWSLLFVIPGIVKMYAYRMVPFILSQNPDMSATDAIRLSVEMTRGHKWDMFIMDVSFIGWYFLGAIALGIGTFFVNPYYDATQAQLYLALRNNAISTRIAFPGNFGLVDVASSMEPETAAPYIDPNKGNGPPKATTEGDGIVDYRDKPFEN